MSNSYNVLLIEDNLRDARLLEEMPVVPLSWKPGRVYAQPEGGHSRGGRVALVLTRSASRRRKGCESPRPRNGDEVCPARGKPEFD